MSLPFNTGCTEYPQPRQKVEYLTAFEKQEKRGALTLLNKIFKYLLPRDDKAADIVFEAIKSLDKELR